MAHKSKKKPALAPPWNFDGRLWEVVVPITFFAVASLVFLYGHALVYFPFWSDENLHLYVASRVAQGASLYGDIHSARPPLALIPLILAFKAQIPALLSARGLNVLCGLATAAILLWLGRRLWGLYAGLAGACLFLVSAELTSRTSYTGINGVALAVTATVACVLVGRISWAGIAAGLSLATGQHAAVVVAVLGLYVFHRNKKDVLAYALWALVTTAAIFGTAWVLGGQSMYEDLLGVHRYHFNGAKADESELQFYLPMWLYENVGILLLAVGNVFLPRAAGEKPQGLWTHSGLLLSLVLAHWGVILGMSGGQILYQHPVFPTLCLLAGVGAWRAGHHLKSLAPNAQTFFVKGLTWTLPLILFTLGGWKLAEWGYEKRDGVDHPFSVYRRHESAVRLQKMTVAEVIANTLKPKVQPQDTLFGWGTLTTYLALQMGIRISGEWADLAPRWIKMGLVSRESIVDKIEKDNVRWFVTPRWFFTTDAYFKKYLETCYHAQVFDRAVGDGQGIPPIVVFEHRDTRPCGFGPK